MKFYGAASFFTPRFINLEDFEHYFEESVMKIVVSVFYFSILINEVYHCDGDHSFNL